MEVKLRPGGADKAYPARPRPKVDRRCGEDSGLNERRSLKLGNEQESLLGGPGWLLCTCDTCYVHSEVVKYILDLALATLSELSADTASTLNLLSWSTCCT